MMDRARTHDTSSVKYHMNVEAFADNLSRAASKAFPNAQSCYYEQVHVLLLSWKDDNLGVIKEIRTLHRIFEKLYGYTTESWLIPSKESHWELNSKILEFVKRGRGSQNLLIVYYGGHGAINEDRNCFWAW
jgi:hypothetical protein